MSRRPNPKRSGDLSVPDRLSSKSTYDARNLVCNFRDAVVTIAAHTMTNSDLHIHKLTGFFIKGHYIICPSLFLLSETGGVNQILITVSNVNGKDTTYCYQGVLVGLDEHVGVAVLRIDTSCAFNKNNAGIESFHPYMNWGGSRDVCPGDAVILLGDISSQATSVVHATVCHNRFTDPHGKTHGELLLLSEKSAGIGVPVVAEYGRVLGMTLSDNNTALSEFFMRRPVKAIIASYECRETVYSKFIESVSTGSHTYFRYIKSSIGIRGELITASDYITKLSVENDNVVRTITDDIYDFHEIIGYRVTQGINDIKVGDIITHINACPLGNSKGQISPALVMWRVFPGDTVAVKYRKQEELFRTEHETDVDTTLLTHESVTI